MKKIIFLAHDPGGYDVIFPIADSFIKSKIICEFYCIGPAGRLNEKYSIEYTNLKEEILKMIQEKCISLLVTGTSWGDTTEIEMIALCKRANIKTISILDYWSNYAERFKSRDGIYIYPDHYLVMDEIAQEEAIRDGVPKEILKVIGHPGLDKYVLYKKQTIKQKEKKINILFLSQPLSELYGDSLGYTEKGVLKDIIRFSKENNYNLKVKFHPKDEEKIKNEYSEFAIQGDLINIMPQYDFIVGMNTMGLLHAALMDICAISYQPNLNKSDGCITNKLGITKLVSSYQQLGKILEEMKNARSHQMELQQLIWMDGKSTQRVSDFLKLYFKNEFNYL